MKKSSKRERERKKKAELFQVRDEDRIIKQSYSAPTEREAIRVQCKSEGIPQNNISQCPTYVDDADFTLLKVSTIPRERLSAAAMPCRRNSSFMDFRCRRTDAPDESNPDIPRAKEVPVEGGAVAFYRKDTRHAETLTNLRMREATVAIAPVTFTSFVFRAT